MGNIRTNQGQSTRMNAQRTTKLCVATILVALATAPLLINVAGAQPRPRPAAANDGAQVLTRGPVHEAFAETVTFDPEPGIVVAKSPPATIEEIPPDQRPAGANVAWIPGYWAWDDERTDFLWVSGIWRALPPGRQWVPGYWGHSGQGAQWTSGYWADAKAREVEYLPEPPATVEVGPNIAAPSVDYVWLPGCWLWQQNRYAWRPGYWAAGQSDWDWIPAHYIWTPRGYVFVDGYHDYSVARRGVLFAPVYFSSGVYAQRGFSYSPTVVINPAVFASHLFLRPGYGHYYYGDYYASNYTAAGFSPWFSFNSSRYGYDPFYAQQRWIHRQDRGWEQNVQAAFQNRRDHENARPPRTWVEQRARIASGGTPNQQNLVVAAPLDELAKSQGNPLRLQPLNKTQRQQFAQHEQAVHQLREQRQKLESSATGTTLTNDPKQFKPTRVRLPASPIVAKSPDPLEKPYAVPKSHQLPQPDLKVEPHPRVTRTSDRFQPRTVNKLPQTGALPRVNQKGPPSPPQPKNELEPVKGGPPPGTSNGPRQGKPQGGSKVNPAGTPNDKPPDTPMDTSNVKPKKKPKP
jgi:WXXGXW repeat (2 copies)